VVRAERPVHSGPHSGVPMLLVGFERRGGYSSPALVGGSRGAGAVDSGPSDDDWWRRPTELGALKLQGTGAHGNAMRSKRVAARSSPMMNISGGRRNKASDGVEGRQRVELGRGSLQSSKKRSKGRGRLRWRMGRPAVPFIGSGVERGGGPMRKWPAMVETSKPIISEDKRGEGNRWGDRFGSRSGQGAARLQAV
jgi:hypothetical protein